MGNNSKVPEKSPEVSDEEDKYESSSEQITTIKFDPKDFADNLVQALSSPPVIQALQSIFEPFISEMKKDINELKSNLDNKENEICNLKQQVEDLMQERRNLTLKIDGLKELPSEESNGVRSAVSCFVSETLNVPIESSDLDTCFRVGAKQAMAKPRRIILTLFSKEIKDRILRERFKLKNIMSADPVYINADLIPKRQEIFKTARQHVKDKQLFRTWIQQGQVMIKDKPDSDPVAVRSLSALNNIVTSNMK